MCVSHTTNSGQKRNLSGWFTLIITVLFGFVSPHSASKQATMWVCCLCITHLLYVDDLKLLMKNEDQLKRALATVKKFSSDIQMTFGLGKCATVNIRHGKVIQSDGVDIDQDTQIRNIDAEETYRCLGMEEFGGIRQQLMKERIKKEYYHRIKRILKTQLNAKNKILAINSLAIPVISYSYGIVKWLKSDLQKI